MSHKRATLEQYSFPLGNIDLLAGNQWSISTKKSMNIHKTKIWCSGTVENNPEM